MMNIIGVFWAWAEVLFRGCEVFLPLFLIPSSYHYYKSLTANKLGFISPTLPTLNGESFLPTVYYL
jgi:hypothetical protein